MRVHTRYQLIAAIVSILSILLLPVTSARHNGNVPATIEGSLSGAGIDEPVADIGVSKLGSPDQVNPGSDITYEITVSNGGPDPADNANLSDQLPATLTFVSLSAPAGWTCMTPAVGAGGPVTCTNPSLSFTSGDVFTLVVNVPVDAPPDTFFTNTATVSTTTFDPNDENNSSTTSTLVMGNSTNVAVTKTASSDQVNPGFPLTYTIQVINSGPDSADNATLNDVLPASVFFVSLSQPAGWTCMTPAVGASGVVSCSNPSLAVTSGDIFTLVVVVDPATPATTVITNTATVSTSTPESSGEDNSDSASTIVVPRDPSAANGKVSGRILDNHGNPVSGTVIRLSGTDSRKTITDANGNYRFENVETGGFYTVTPSRANYDFNPFNRSFSQLADQTEAVFTAEATGDIANPLDTPEYFVRQQYLDVMAREPEESGFNYWSDQILACGDEVSCVNRQRRDVAAAFFMAEEYQASGSYIHDVYAGALGRGPAFSEYSVDRQLVVGGATLDATKIVFAQNFVRRTEFMARYQNAITAESFVAALIQNVHSSAVDLSGDRDGLMAAYNSESSLDASRAAVVRMIADNATFKQSQYNRAFVLTEYFAYLRRDAETDGYNFWVNVLNTGDPGNYRGMVCSFTTSGEYQNRFSTVVSHNNGECSRQ